MTFDHLLNLQAELGASERLLAHHKVVAGVAEQIADKLLELEINLDKTQIVAMAAIHDIGKIEAPQELSESGTQHEQLGFELARENEIPEVIAEACIFHGSEDYASLSLEGLMVILADKLWKGKRIEALENHVTKRVSKLLESDYWIIFLELDSCFEGIADKGHERLLLMPKQ